MRAQLATFVHPCVFARFAPSRAYNRFGGSLVPGALCRGSSQVELDQMKLQLTVTRAALRGKEAELATEQRAHKAAAQELARLRHLVGTYIEGTANLVGTPTLKVREPSSAPPTLKRTRVHVCLFQLLWLRVLRF